MRRGFLVFILFFGSLFYGWDQGVSRGGVGRYIERNPYFYGGERILYILGSFHEIWNQNQQALEMYARIRKVYPDSRWSDEAQFGVASSYERLKDRKKALEEFENYMKEFPNGRFHASVSKNISLLKQ
jgi:tetratricopeptide (TPR) repeat protein